MSLRTHLDVLEESADKYGARPVFQLPVPTPESEGVREWRPVSYAQFRLDVETYAKFWARRLAADGLPKRSVIGLWLGGMTYRDVLHIYGLARANYVPQLVSLRLSNPDVVYELLDRGKARFLIYDESFGAIIADCPLPRHVAREVGAEEVTDEALLPLLSTQLEPEDTIMIFHTSGSTSGSPKLVPASLRWIDSMIKKAEQVARPRDSASTRQDVSVWMGSMCHIAQTFMLLGSLHHGSCTIQPSVVSFPSSELTSMISRCSLNRLTQFASFLSMHFRTARSDAKLLARLVALDDVTYAGLPLGREDEVWALENGVRLRNLFGSTECGALMVSTYDGTAASKLLRPLDGTSYAFTPASPSSPPDASPPQNANAALLELVVLSASPDCPAAPLRGASEHFHTGDLFTRAPDADGRAAYVFRGRADDWLKTANALRCDARAIEDNVRATCGDLVHECVVVGAGRPGPVLFVEAHAGTAGGEERLKRDVVRRTRAFHARRYEHERIASTRYVVVVPRGTLPRTATKGNVRRQAVEEAFKDLLDEIYGDAQ